MAMMKGRHIVSGLVGFVYAFMVYGGAARNNIIALSNYGMTGVAIIAIAWALLIPLMYMYLDKLYQKWTTQSEENDAQT